MSSLSFGSFTSIDAEDAEYESLLLDAHVAVGCKRREVIAVLRESRGSVVVVIEGGENDPLVLERMGREWFLTPVTRFDYHHSAPCWTGVFLPAIPVSVGFAVLIDALTFPVQFMVRQAQANAGNCVSDWSEFPWTPWWWSWT